VSAARTTTSPRFDPASVGAFRFTHRDLSPGGTVRLGYALDEHEFTEVIQLPAPTVSSPAADHLLDLLHWVAGVSYYKAAIPTRVDFAGTTPARATTQLLAALYTEGLGEFAVVNHLDALPNPQLPQAVEALGDRGSGARTRTARSATDPRSSERGIASLLVPVGGGKDSAVAIEIARASGLPTTLFSVGDATPIRQTAEVSGLPRHIAMRRIDPRLLELNAAGALNGHVPITAIVSCVALLTAATQGIDAVLVANERSASAGNFVWKGVEINHQFSKSRRAERLLADAVAEIDGAPRIFSILRPASEIAIARAFAKLERYHPAFTSCNRVFKLNPSERLGSWCCDCDKCRFVFLILAPFLRPEALTEVFGKDMLDDPDQYDGFALLAATGGDKPFECVGEVEECIAAIHLISRHWEWRERPVVRRLVDEVLSERDLSDGEIAALFLLHDDHDIPDALIEPVREILRP
jgi:hypothetical protein